MVFRYEVKQRYASSMHDKSSKSQRAAKSTTAAKMIALSQSSDQDSFIHSSPSKSFRKPIKIVSPTKSGSLYKHLVNNKETAKMRLLINAATIYQAHRCRKSVRIFWIFLTSQLGH